MDSKYPKNINNRPKRRRNKNNPYYIFSAGVEAENLHYYVSFEDENGMRICTEITKCLYDQFDQWELEDLSFLHEVERHYEHSILTEQSLNKRALHKPETPDQIVFQAIEKEKLVKAMEALTAVQYRRLVMYFWDGMSLQEISAIEGCKYQAVQDSIEHACIKIKKILQSRLV